MATKKKEKKKRLSKRELRRIRKEAWKKRRETYGPTGSRPKAVAVKKEEITAAVKKELATEESELDKLRLELERVRFENELLRRMSEFVADSDWTRADGTIAKNPSSLRHLGEPTRIMREEMIKAYWVGGIEDGEKQGDLTLWYDLAEYYAKINKVEIREVFTLFYSP